MTGSRVAETLRRLHRDERGGALTEYGLIAAALAIPGMIGLGLIIAAVSGVLNATMSGLFNYMTR